MESLYETLEFDVVLDRLADLAVSSLGRERIFNIQPFTELSALHIAHHQITELRDIMDYDQMPPIDDVGDLTAILKKVRVVGGMLQPEECARVARFLYIIRQLSQFFKERQEQNPHLSQITSYLKPQKALEHDIIQCVDVETFEIKNSASAELASLRKSIERAQASARRKMESKLKALSAQGYLQENVISVRNGRLVLVVKDEYRRKVKGLVHDQSATGSSFFIEPLEVVDDNNRIRELQTEEAKEIERILRRLTDSIRAHQEDIQHNQDLFAELDAVYAKARLSKLLSAFQPELVNDSIVDLAQARHPLLLLRLGERHVVPLDVTLGKDIETLIISGPNAGGKTVALKTIGLVTLMALCGLHIPAQPHSKIGLLSQIFANIGDQQSLENDLSTFSSHVQQLKTIAERADSRSLVLIDEIGSGTDPEEGTGLAIALMERLTQQNCLTVVTTHQSPLKAFAYQTENVENASLEFDVSTLQPTYNFRVGIPGSSYAFEIAERMGLPNDVIERARSRVGSQKNQLEGLILELEENVQKHAELARQANLKETEYRGLLKLYQEKNNALQQELKHIKRQAAEEAEALLQNANATIENTIREIRESQADREAIQHAKEQLAFQKEKVESIKSAVEPEPETEPDTREPIAKGDSIRWKNSGATGQVLTEPDKKARVMVQFEGGMKVQLPTAELERAKRKKRKSVVRVNVDHPKSSAREVDLRGMLSEDALQELEHFLDAALLSGLHEVHVIHGKGTGKLRKSVGQFLQHHPQVESFRLGYWNEGDSGVTVVQLKGHKKETVEPHEEF